MFKKLISEQFIQKLAGQIVSSIEVSLKKYQTNTEQRIDEVLEHVQALRIEVKSLDQRLTSKEIRDKSEYGHVQYKISSLQNEITDKNKKAS